MIFPPGATSQSIVIGFYDDDGLPLTGKVAADFPTISYQKAGANAAVTITLSNLAAITTAYSSGGVKEIGNGKYRLDLPDAAISAAAMVDISGEGTNKHVICPPIEVKYVQSDGRQWLGTGVPTPATAGYPVVIQKVGTGTGETNLTGGKVPATIAAGDIAPNALTASALASDAVTEIQNGLSTLDATAVQEAIGLSGPTLDSTLAAIFTAVGNINNLSALANINGPLGLEIPDTGTTQYQFVLKIKDVQGNLVDLSEDPTIVAVNVTGDDRSANLSAITHEEIGTYTFTYGVADDAAKESVRITATGTTAVEFAYCRADWIVVVEDYDATTRINTILAKVTAIEVQADLIGTNDADSPAAATAQVTIAANLDAKVSLTATQSSLNSKIPGNIAMTGSKVWALDGDGEPIAKAAALASVADAVTAALARLGAFTGSGVNTVLGFFRAIFNKTATAPSDLTSGGLTGDVTTDSLEAMRDNAGGGGASVDDILAAPVPNGNSEGTVGGQLALLSSNNNTTRSPVQAEQLELIRGDAYLNSQGRALVFTKQSGSNWPTDLTGWTITLTARPSANLLRDYPAATATLAVAGAVIVATGTGQQVRINDITNAMTSVLTPTTKGYVFDVQANQGSGNGTPATLVLGVMTVLEDVTSP